MANRIEGPRTPPPAPVGQENYTVRRGDTLSAIARSHGVALKDLVRANPQIADPNRITAGQEVRIPAGRPPSSSPAPAKSQSDGVTFTKSDKPNLFEKLRDAVKGEVSETVAQVGQVATHVLAPPKLEVKGAWPAAQGTVYEVKFSKPMTREQAIDHMFKNGKLPSEYDDKTYAGEPTPERRGILVPVGKREPATEWQLYVPSPGGKSYAFDAMKESVSAKILDTRVSRAAIPPWTPARTANLVKAGRLPPSPSEPGLQDVRSPRPGVTTWREGNGLFWHDAKTGRLEGYRMKGELTKLETDLSRYVEKDGMSPEAALDRLAKDYAQINRDAITLFVVGGSPGSLFNDVVGALRGK